MNLANAHRQRGGDPAEGDGEAALRRGLVALPDAADLHHALGLLLARRHDNAGALAELATAARLAPQNSRYAYVYAIGLNSAGRPAEALEVLRAGAATDPADADMLAALVSILLERNGPGDREAALGYARKLSELNPGDPQVRQLIEQLEKAK